MIPNTMPPNVPTEQESSRRLTVKLTGRAQALDWRPVRTLSSRARGAEPPTLHGPLQLLLGALSHSDKVWDSNKR